MFGNLPLPPEDKLNGENLCRHEETYAGVASKNQATAKKE
jgi:hypothetical protein